MAKLTEKQTNVLQRMAAGERLHRFVSPQRGSFHFPETADKVNGNIANALIDHGYIKNAGMVSASTYEYTLTDAGRAAIAQPVSVATDAAPAPDAAQTAAAEAVTVADLPPFAPTETDYANAMKLIDQQTAKIEALEAFYNLARKLDVTWDMWELVSHRDDNSFIDANGILHRLHEAGYEIDDPYIHNPDAVQRETRPEQIARLQRNLEAAKAEADALRKQVRETEDLLMQNGHHTPTVRLADQVSAVYRELSAEAERAADGIDDLQQYRGWANELIEGLDHISPLEALTRLLSFRRDYQAYTARNADPDAALVAARQRADDGTRLTTADVRAQAEFAEED